MTDRAIDYLRRRYLPILRRCRLLNALAFGAAITCAPGAWAGGIVTDGRTQTNVATAGQVTDVTTGTVRGDTGYNSFRKFNVDGGETVNLHTPDGASKLINLVHDERTHINGVLNAYKDGRIGGHVYFLNPHGVVVGASGVLNVGRLTVQTPTAAFMDRIISPQGVIDVTASQLVFDGQVPISETGLISVEGTINATDEVELRAGEVHIGQRGSIIAGAQVKAKFSDLVNVEGMQAASAVEVGDDGVVRIFATGDVRMAGEVNVDNKEGDAGDIVVIADRDATLEATAKLSAASEDGDGGFIEFSARKTVHLQGGGFDASSANGDAGSILIDPEEVVQDGPGFDMFSNGADITIEADQRISLNNVVLSSRQVAGSGRSAHQNNASTGASGDIALRAPTIELTGGSMLLAHGNTASQAGKVTVEAKADQNDGLAAIPLFGNIISTFDRPVSSLTMTDATITGGEINIHSIADDTREWKDGDKLDSILSFLDNLAFFSDGIASIAEANLTIDGASMITGMGTVDIRSEAKTEAVLKIFSSGAGFAYAAVDNDATTTIGGTTTISGPTINIASNVEGKISAALTTLYTGGINPLTGGAAKYVDIALSVGDGDMDATTTVGGSTTVNAPGGEINVTSKATKDVGVEAEATAYDDGTTAGAIAFSNVTTDTTATLNGNIDAATLNVKSEIDTEENSIKAEAGVGDDVSGALKALTSPDEVLVGKLSDKISGGQTSSKGSGGSSKFGLAASYAEMNHVNTVNASIGGGADVDVTGDVLVDAKMREIPTYKVNSSTGEDKLPGGGEEQKSVALSAAIANIDLESDVNAFIADGAFVDAGGAIDVVAISEYPYTIQQWVDFIEDFEISNFDDVVSTATEIFDIIGNGNFGLMMGWAQSAAESDKVSLSGSINILNLTNNADAYIGDADINAGSAPSGLQDVTVFSKAFNGVINLAGVFDFDLKERNVAGSQSGSFGFGGAYLEQHLDGGGESWIESGAMVNADDLLVEALTRFETYSIAASGGKAGKVSINGTLTINDVDTMTRAQIQPGSVINVNDLVVSAVDKSELVAIGGGIASGGNAGIGITIGVNELDRDTYALIGNMEGESLAGGSVTAANNVLVYANNDGFYGSFSLAATLPDTGGKSDESKSKNTKKGKGGVGVSGDVSINTIDDTTEAVINGGVTATANSGSGMTTVAKFDDDDATDHDLEAGLAVRAMNTTSMFVFTGAATLGTGQSFGLAGSFSENDIRKDVHALISNATIDVNSNGSLDVDADAGGSLRAIAAGGSGADKVAIAGSIAISEIENETTAKIESSVVTVDNGDVDVNAQDESQMLAIAGAIAFGAQGGGVGAGYSFNNIANLTEASITGGSVTAGQGVKVLATNNNQIESWAASIGAGKNAGIAGAASDSFIFNTVDAKSVGAMLSSSGGRIEIEAMDTSQIKTRNGSVGLGKVGFGASVANNHIGNIVQAGGYGGSLVGTHVDIEATQMATIDAFSAAGSGGAYVGISASLSINQIENQTIADSTANLTAVQDVRVIAMDTSEVDAFTGGFAFGGGAFGAAGSYNNIDSTIDTTISGGSINAGGDALVKAVNDATIESQSAGGAVAGGTAFAGSISINTLTNETTATVSSGATITAQHNALVLAQSDQIIDAFAGAVALSGAQGLGGSVSVNDIDSQTLAEVHGVGTSVLGRGLNGLTSVPIGTISDDDGMTLADRVELGGFRGSAVIASATDEVESIIGTLSGGGDTAVAATVGVNLFSGSTKSRVYDGASVNGDLSGVHADHVGWVKAFHHTVMDGFLGNAALGLATGGFGAGLDFSIIDHETLAEVEAATVRGNNWTEVEALATLDYESTVVGAGIGTLGGVTGSFAAGSISGTTIARVNGGDVSSMNALKINAETDIFTDVFTGGVAGSGGLGVGITEGLLSVDTITKAQTLGSTELNANGIMWISATTTRTHEMFAGTATAAGGAGFAGTIGLHLIDGQTVATVGGGTQINQDATYGGPLQDVNVEATDRTTINSDIGGVAIGLGTGVGAAVDVIIVRSNATAEILSGAQVTADRDINVTADSLRVIDSFSLAAAGGLSNAISGGVSVVSVGGVVDDDAQSESEGSVEQVSMDLSSSPVGSALDNDVDSTAQTRDRANAQSGEFDVRDDYDDTPTAAGRTARALVEASATLHAGRDVSVMSINVTDVDAEAVGAAAGGLAIGGGVAVITVDDDVLASLSGDVTAGGTIDIDAADREYDMDSESDQNNKSKIRTRGGGGGLVGLGASVAIINKGSTVVAQIGDDAVINGAPSITVDAAVNHHVDVFADGGAVGVVGIGASISRANLDGSATVRVGDNADVTAGSLTMKSDAHSTAESLAKAMVGGILSGTGTDARATDGTSAYAELGDGAVLNINGGLVDIDAAANPHADAEVDGVSVSVGVSVGVSIAKATLDNDVWVFSGNNVQITADNLNIKAQLHDRGNAARAFAEAVAGGLLFGGGATDADARSTSDVRVDLGNGNTYTIAMNMSLMADSDTSVKSEADGEFFGALAGGGNDADAVIVSNTDAVVGNGGTVNVGDTLTIYANSHDALDAHVNSGSGGLGALVAGGSSTSNTSNTFAGIRDGGTGAMVHARLLDVDAIGRTNFDSSANASKASVVGYSGARTDNNVSKTTIAEIGNNNVVFVEALDMVARNDVDKPNNSGYNILSGSGGLLDGAAANSDTNVSLTADVIFGVGSTVMVDVPGIEPKGTFSVMAYNETNAFDEVKLDSGGAVAIARTESFIDVNQSNANVHVQDNATVWSDGDMFFTTYSTADIKTRANSKTYGLAGAAEGRTRSKVHANHMVLTGSGALVESEENVTMRVGLDNDLSVDAETRLWNKTAIPIETDPEAHGEAHTTNYIMVLNSNGAVRAVRDINLLTGDGGVSTRGFGRGTDLYRQVAEAVANFFGGLVGADEVSLDIEGGSTSQVSLSGIQVDGTVEAGTRHHQFLVFNEDGTLNAEATTENLLSGSFGKRLNVSVTRELQDRIDVLDDLIAEYADNPDIAGAFQAEKEILEKKKADLGGDNPVADFIDINPITARSGDIVTTGDFLAGSGHIIAPGDVIIEIENNSKAFLTTSQLTIPEERGGRITMNGVPVSSNADILARNRKLFGVELSQLAGKGTANFATVETTATSPQPQINVFNTYNPDDPGKDPNALFPELYVNADISNLDGKVFLSSTGSILVSANITAETIKITTLQDFVKSFTFGFTHTGGDPSRDDTVESREDSSELSAKITGALGDNFRTITANTMATDFETTIAGNTVFIAGEKLNIAGPIQSGIPSKGIAISNSLLAGKNIAGFKAAYDAAVANGQEGTRFMDLNDPALDSQDIKVAYDAKFDRLEVGGVRVQGGHLELYGDVFSTGNGHLRVMDGYGTINISNTTTYDIALNRLDVGTGIEGLIKVTDTSKRAPDGSALVTEFTRVGNTMYAYNSVTVDAEGNPSNLILMQDGRGTDFGQSVSYDVTDGRRFNWINAETQVLQQNRIYTQRVAFGLDFLIPDYDNPDTTSIVSDVRTERARGDWLSSNESSTAKYQLDYSRFDSGWIYQSESETDRFCLGVGDVCLFEQVEKTAVFRKTIREYFNHSLNASIDIPVSFIGADTGTLNVTTTGAVYLESTLRNGMGETNITAPGGVFNEGAGARIVADRLMINAADGSIGAEDSVINIDLQNDDSYVTATAKDLVAMHELEGDMRVMLVQATDGNVILSADRNIVSAAAQVVNGFSALGAGQGIATAAVPSAVIIGNEISLDSDSGTLGAVDNPLPVDSGPDSPVNYESADSIFLIETDGDMFVESVVSTGGDVYLTAANGSILDANDIETVDETTVNELLDIWEDNRLLGQGAVDSAEETVENHQALKRAEYDAYWRSRNVREVDDGAGGATYEADAYDPDFSFSLSEMDKADLMARNGWNDAAIMNYEDQQTQAYHDAHEAFGGMDYDPGFVYTPTAQEVADLSDGTAWTEAQLSNAISAGLLKETTDTVVRIEAPNVVGRDIVLAAPLGNIGETLTPYVIDLTNGFDNLTDDDRVALLTGEVIDYSFSGNFLSISQKEDIDATTDNGISAAALGDIYLGSEENLGLGVIASATSNVRIKSGRGIQSVAGDGVVNVVGVSVILEAAEESLGAMAQPIIIDQAGFSRFTARGKEGVYVYEHSGDMLVDAVYSPADVHLKADGSILDFNTDKRINIRGDNMSLEAGDMIGMGDTLEHYLDVGLNPDGRLSAKAPNGIYIAAAQGRDLNIGDIDTDGALGLAAIDSSLTLDGTIRADGGIDFFADDDITLSDVTTVSSISPINFNAGQDGDGGIWGDPGSVVNAGVSLSLQAPDDINLPDVVHTGGPDALMMTVTGLGDTEAGDVTLGIFSDIGASFDMLYVTTGDIDGDTPLLAVEAGRIVKHVSLENRRFNTRVEAVDKTNKPYDAQFYTLDGKFSQAMDHRTIMTDIFVINYDPFVLINDKYSNENSLVRLSFKDERIDRLLSETMSDQLVALLQEAYSRGIDLNDLLDGDDALMAELFSEFMMDAGNVEAVAP